VFSKAHDFFERIDKNKEMLPVWNGDMYLELHRGTYTTQALNKRLNRRAEELYRDAEIWDSFSIRKQDVLKEGWKLLLFNQFHDIIPGTSIPEVYETSKQEYDKVFELGFQ